MDDIKDIIAANLIKLRTDAGFTQLQLAQMLNYSDKAVSKWERAEAVPDIHVLVSISKIYGVTLDELVTDHKDNAIKPRMNTDKKRIFIAVMSVSLCFLIALIVFTVLYFIPDTDSYAGCLFSVAFLASTVTFTVMANQWWNRLVKCIAVSLIVWSAALLIHIFFLTLAPDNTDALSKAYILYIVAFVMQIMIVLWFAFRRVR